MAQVIILQANQLLKFLAFILFAFELVVSVYASGISIGLGNENGTQLNPAAQSQNLCFPILFELNKNEEEKGGHKLPFEDSGGSPVELYHMSHDVHRADITSYTNALQQFKASPALFQVHCKLQI